MSNTSLDVIECARGELGYSRWDDPEPGTKYGRWYARLVGDSYFGESGVPYCDMFVSWVMAQVGGQCAGIPAAYCPSTLAAGRSQGRMVYNEDGRQGDVVLFDWNGDGVADHIGFVEENRDGYFVTVEGNTNNGCVARRTRSYSTVIGVIRPSYDGSGPGYSGGGIDVDGYWGPATTRALQAKMGTTVDGIVSSQWGGNAANNDGLSSASWEWVSDAEGSDVIRAMQRVLGVDADGFFGPATTRALQAHMGTPVDGCISAPSLCVMQMQQRLNAGTF